MFIDKIKNFYIKNNQCKLRYEGLINRLYQETINSNGLCIDPFIHHTEIVRQITTIICHKALDDNHLRKSIIIISKIIDQIIFAIDSYESGMQLQHINIITILFCINRLNIQELYPALTSLPFTKFYPIELSPNIDTRVNYLIQVLNYEISKYDHNLLISMINLELIHPFVNIPGLKESPISLAKSRQSFEILIECLRALYSTPHYYVMPNEIEDFAHAFNFVNIQPELYFFKISELIMKNHAYYSIVLNNLRNLAIYSCNNQLIEFCDQAISKNNVNIYAYQLPNCIINPAFSFPENNTSNNFISIETTDKLQKIHKEEFADNKTSVTNTSCQQNSITTEMQAPVKESELDETIEKTLENLPKELTNTDKVQSQITVDTNKIKLKNNEEANINHHFEDSIGKKAETDLQDDSEEVIARSVFPPLTNTSNKTKNSKTNQNAGSELLWSTIAKKTEYNVIQEHTSVAKLANNNQADREQVQKTTKNISLITAQTSNNKLGEDKIHSQSKQKSPHIHQTKIIHKSTHKSSKNTNQFSLLCDEKETYSQKEQQVIQSNEDDNVVILKKKKKKKKKKTNSQEKVPQELKSPNTYPIVTSEFDFEGLSNFYDFVDTCITNNYFKKIQNAFNAHKPPVKDYIFSVCLARPHFEIFLTKDEFSIDLKALQEIIQILTKNSHKKSVVKNKKYTCNSNQNSIMNAYIGLYNILTKDINKIIEVSDILGIDDQLFKENKVYSDTHKKYVDTIKQYSIDTIKNEIKNIKNNISPNKTKIKAIYKNFSIALSKPINGELYLNLLAEHRHYNDAIELIKMGVDPLNFDEIGNNFFSHIGQEQIKEFNAEIVFTLFKLATEHMVSEQSGDKYHENAFRFFAIAYNHFTNQELEDLINYIINYVHKHSDPKKQLNAILLLFMGSNDWSNIYISLEIRKMYKVLKKFNTFLSAILFKNINNHQSIMIDLLHTNKPTAIANYISDKFLEIDNVLNLFNSRLDLYSKAMEITFEKYEQYFMKKNISTYNQNNSKFLMYKKKQTNIFNNIFITLFGIPPQFKIEKETMLLYLLVEIYKKNKNFESKIKIILKKSLTQEVLRMFLFRVNKTFTYFTKKISGSYQNLEILLHLCNLDKFDNEDFIDFYTQLIELGYKDEVIYLYEKYKEQINNYFPELISYLISKYYLTSNKTYKDNIKDIVCNLIEISNINNGEINNYRDRYDLSLILTCAIFECPVEIFTALLKFRPNLSETFNGKPIAIYFDLIKDKHSELYDAFTLKYLKLPNIGLQISLNNFFQYDKNEVECLVNQIKATVLSEYEISFEFSSVFSKNAVNYLKSTLKF